MSILSSSHSKRDHLDTLFTLDVGNQNPHIGLFHGASLKEIFPWNIFLEQKLWEHPLYQKTSIVISKVSQINRFAPHLTIPETLKEKFIFLRSQWTSFPFLDMPVHYEQTLGDDRLFLSYWYYKNKMNLPLTSPSSPFTALLIDAGTFTTLDVVSHKGFLGGFIIPGFQTYLNAIEKGHQLPSLSLQDLQQCWSKLLTTPNHLLPQSSHLYLPHGTKEALLYPLFTMIQAQLLQIIKHDSPQEVIITGGQAKFFEDFLLPSLCPATIAIHHHPHALHYAIKLCYEIGLQMRKHNEDKEG